MATPTTPEQAAAAAKLIAEQMRKALDPVKLDIYAAIYGNSFRSLLTEFRPCDSTRKMSNTFPLTRSPSSSRQASSPTGPTSGPGSDIKP